MINNDIKIKTEYCLNCINKPCSQKGCPLNNDIPEIIQLLKEGKYKDAYKTLSKTTVFPAICGRICPHTKQCEGSCIRGIKGEPVNIGKIEKYIGDLSIENNWDILTDNEQNVESNKENQKLKDKKVAVIGGGPAGLTCAAFLAKKGVEVTIYEKYDYLGGLLVHGIPDFRLSKDIVNKTVSKILKLGIQVKYNQEINKNIYLDDLEKDYDAIFLSFGANISNKMGIEGEDLLGVYGGNELLEYKTYPDCKDKKVIINGGGNVAIDVARTIKRLGAKKVTIVYRRSRTEMPAEDKEIEEGIREGIEILFQNNIVKILKNSKNEVSGVELIKTKLVEKEGEKRLIPVNIEDSNYEIEADYVIMALGSHPQEFVSNLGLELNKWGNIKIDKNGKTSRNKVYAGGDLAGCKGTVAWACRSGRDVANNIIANF